MKLKVIGWTCYDDPDVERGYCGWAAINAIMDEIREKGYIFTGCHHQEYPRCAPVLNDGKKRLMTQRGWGRLMADVYECKGVFDYSRFAFSAFDDDEEYTFPPLSEEYRPLGEGEVNGAPLSEYFTEEELRQFGLDGESLSKKEKYEPRKYDIKSEEELSETFTVTTDSISLISEAEAGGTITLKDAPELKFIERGDTLVIKYGGSDYLYKIAEVNREKDFTEEEKEFVETARYYFDEEINRKADEIFARTPMKIVISTQRKE